MERVKSKLMRDAEEDINRKILRPAFRDINWIFSVSIREVGNDKGITLRNFKIFLTLPRD